MITHAAAATAVSTTAVIFVAKRSAIVDIGAGVSAARDPSAEAISGNGAATLWLVMASYG